MAMIASATAARNAIRRSPHLRQCAAMRPVSSRSATPAVSAVLSDGDPRTQTPRSAAALAAALAAITSATLLAADGTARSKTLAESKVVDAAYDDGKEVDDSTRILNWSGTHSVDLAPGAYREPETVDELVRIVSDAHRTGRHVRPVGSALSPNGIAFDPRGMVCLSNLDRIIEVNKDEMTVTVEAGARVSQVLDALRPHGLTLPNLASIAEQQVGGFVSVGAHGTGAAIPPCDEFVEALTLVTPSRYGVVRMTEESHGPLFRLARLGLGGLGILSEVTLRVVPAHRLVEQTVVMTRSEAKGQLSTLLKRHKHVRYMWIPYEDAVVVVTNDPENELPLMGPGTEVPDGNGGKKKVVTEKDLQPRYSVDEQLDPLRRLLRRLLEDLEYTLDDETMNGMGFADLRDAILSCRYILDPDNIKECNRAEHEFWAKAQGLEVAPSDRKLQFDCGGQQWVYEVCFPAGTYGVPNSNSMDFVEDLLGEIEATGIAAPSPIEQRWSAASTSPLSPASVGPRQHESYESRNALFSWVGVIMYLQSESFDPAGIGRFEHRRGAVTKAFKDEYCKLVRKVGEKYGMMCHWAKLEVPHGGDSGGDANTAVAESVRAHLGEQVIGAYNAARDMYDPKRVLSCSLLDQIFGSTSEK